MPTYKQLPYLQQEVGGEEESQGAQYQQPSQRTQKYLYSKS